eukprot:Sspe_Gene.79843::Locus_50169_Transcript_2_2_Confidence_0.750_Length_324::g.79843::m.79843
MLMQKFEKRGVQPNNYGFNSLLSAAGRQGRLEKMSEILGEMTKRGLKADTVTFSMLLRSVRDEIEADHVRNDGRRKEELQAMAVQVVQVANEWASLLGSHP